MTRFEMELSGMLGECWKKHAEEELEKVRAELKAGMITIDTMGVARNCIGRALMGDMLEKVVRVTDKVDAEATQKARDAEVEKSISEYRERMKNHKPSAEELFEMRAAFGPGAKVVDVFTGQTYCL